ncbi:MAG: hypothetical protein J5871_03835 [Bacteroidales bacterium]|nr:hypothetical protein [Bacteroidales bacterium]
MKKSIALLAGLLLCVPLLRAQSKAEAAQYARLQKKPAVKAAEKFLRQFPASVYTGQVMRWRDSLLFYALSPEDAQGVRAFAQAHPDSPFREQAAARIKAHNTSPVSREEAGQTAATASDVPLLDAIGWRKDNTDRLLALDASLQLHILSPAGQRETTRTLPVHSLQETPPPPSLVLPMEIIAPLENRYYLHFGYCNGEEEYVEVLYLPDEDILHQVLFYGNPLPRAQGEAYRIEGQCPEMMEGLSPTAEVRWLNGRIAENPSLVAISRADLLTDNAIRWWMERNAQARQQQTAKLTFGQLDPASSLVSAYKKAAKEKGKRGAAALLDIRGYTVICTGNAQGEYTLVWCEPLCRNKRRDPFLNTIYFDSDGTTLHLFYYKGNRTFKRKISLTSQTLRMQP